MDPDPDTANFFIENIGLFIAMLICLICSGFFSATETAFTSFNKIRMKNSAQDGNKKASFAYLAAVTADRKDFRILLDACSGLGISRGPE